MFALSFLPLHLSTNFAIITQSRKQAKTVTYRVIRTLFILAGLQFIRLDLESGSTSLSVTGSQRLVTLVRQAPTNVARRFASNHKVSIAFVIIINNCHWYLIQYQLLINVVVMNSQVTSMNGQVPANYCAFTET